MTKKYTNHTIMTTDKKFISCKRETEVILEMVYSGRDFVNLDGKTITVFSDKIVTEENGVKRTTVVEIV